MSLYERFCQLDRSGGGFISAEEFLSVPEFAVNPLSQVLIFLCVCKFIYINIHPLTYISSICYMYVLKYVCYVMLRVATMHEHKLLNS